MSSDADSTTSQVPRIYQVHPETWTGPEQDETPAARRIVRYLLGYALPAVVGVVLYTIVPGLFWWVLGACAVWFVVSVVVAIIRGRRSRTRL